MYVERGLLAQAGSLAFRHAPGHRYAIITDSTVFPLYGESVELSFRPHTIDGIRLPPGESSKSREMWAQATDHLLDAGFGRDSTLVALGGGVVGDLTGFVAATYMRGIPFIQIPTTLLAMVDAAIGGKTGVDTPAGKNLVGAFHLPAAILIDPQVLVTLPLRQLRTGLAEVIKHGVVADGDYLESVRRSLPEILSTEGAGSDTMQTHIVRSIEIKTDVVGRDLREGGIRKILNFGHTVGHAIESVMNYSVPHGESVAIGMAIESELAEQIGTAEPGTAGAVRDVLLAAGLPVSLPAGCSADRMLDAMKSDKKARDGELRLALPVRIGEMAGKGDGWTVSVNESQLREVLR